MDKTDSTDRHGVRLTVVPNAVFAVAVVLVLAVADTLSNVVSHAALFHPLVSMSSSVVNGKVYFEIGLLIASLLFAVFDGPFRKSVGIASAGAMALGVAGLVACWAVQSEAADFGFSEMFSLVAFGAGFIGVKLFAHYLLFKAQSIVLLVMCVASGKVVKTVLGFIVFSLSGETQAAAVVVLVCIWAVGLGVALRWRHRTRLPHDLNVLASPGLSVSYLLARAFLASIILASMQAFSTYGVYGDSYLSGDSFYVPFSLFTLLVPLFAWVFFALPAKRGAMGGSYRNSFLIILLGLFIVSAQSSGTWILSEQVSTLLLTLLEMMGHVVFWTAIISACWLAEGKAMKIIGGTMAVFAAASIFWIVIMQSLNALVTTIILAVAYLSVIAIMRLFPKISIVKTSDKSLVDEGYLLAIAEEHDLSPRETDVFLLLAQGRSRRYIAQELYISDGTAKTHITRIYQKLGVKTKQDMLAKIMDS